jgi:5-methylcytosine-specific restriction endonuclease McrA
MPKQSPDDYLEHIATALAELVAGNRAAADTAIEPLLVTLQERGKRPAITPALSGQIFRRDGYHCRYCGGRVVPAAVLHATALIWPAVIPTHPHWRTDMTHPVFVSRGAMVDHIAPHAHGGSSSDLNNLATACTPCNMQKNEFTLERLGWSLLEPMTTDWDGLTRYYPILWELASALATPSQTSYHSTWLRVLAPST